MTPFRFQHHTPGLEPAFSESLYVQPYNQTGYGLAHHAPPRHMTSDTYDHSNSHYFRDYHYMYGNQFTPYRLQQRSFHRRNQNQQPSQHRPQYSPYTNTGIDQEHDRSSTNLTSTDRILAMLRIKREARLKLRDQSNQDNHRLGSAAQEHILEKLRIRRKFRTTAYIKPRTEDWYSHASHARTASARTQPIIRTVRITRTVRIIRTVRTIRTALAINQAQSNTHTPDD